MWRGEGVNTLIFSNMSDLFNYFRGNYSYSDIPNIEATDVDLSWFGNKTKYFSRNIKFVF